MGKIVLLTDPGLLLHDTGGGLHPEVPERLTVIGDHLRRQFGESGLRTAEPGTAQWPWLLEAHDEGYLLRFEEAALAGRSWFDHRDNGLSYYTYDAALTAAAAGPAAVEVIEGGGEEVPFCLVRPPGHHAESARAMGFCFLNNAVIAVRYWQRTHERKRIAVVDWDAHHGNGIQHAFEGDGDVLYISIHEHPTFSFPGTGYAGEKGVGEGAGATLNLPLQPGGGDDAVRRAVGEKIESALENFAPDGLVVAAGFDGHLQDDMSGLAFSTGLYGELGAAARRWAGDLCGGRLVSILEGGYHLPVLGESVGAYLAGLAGD